MDAVRVDPDVMGGTPCFAGTRVPVQNLFDYLEGGETLDDFLGQFPTVQREHARKVLELASETFLASLTAA